jgi:predicted O-methyltransferase YrrM
MNNFIRYNSWFDAEYRDKLRGRFPSVKAALNLLYQLPNHRIVEVGCTRRPEAWSEGNSTFVFAQFVSLYGGHLTSIDIEKDNLEEAKKVVEQFRQNVSFIWADSLNILPQMGEGDFQIDLFYPDSMDVPESGDATAGQEQNLKEVRNAMPLMHDKSIILLDDNDMANGGKTRLTKDYLTQQGWREIIDSNQSLWIP